MIIQPAYGLFFLIKKYQTIPEMILVVSYVIIEIKAQGASFKLELKGSFSLIFIFVGCFLHEVVVPSKLPLLMERLNEG